ncbi:MULTISPECIES: phage tail sheath C-terminal domain-containing protein [unclassified Clostridium]|uniref:phage tail sheath C-terminal domain-containing protein n=1 Tax=unclassified Clostridium TaxID=2614128 RepID=UPI0002984E44|nr:MULTISPECIES: phage tail sheath C-terminal domain-containing protein [unclassified Clostridium]EKQ50265.1 MAG: Phage tail sheath protein [Clostridium sp. Maddingley MBC34-26]
MEVTTPNIDVSFRQKAGTLVDRSERGYAILIIRDNTNKAFNYIEYDIVTDVKEDDYTESNYKYIKDIFTFAPYKTCIVRIDVAGESTSPTIADALNIVSQNVKTGWITIADGTQEEYNTLASWTKTKEIMEKKTYKSVVYKATAPDSKHVVNFYNDKVTFVDSRGEETGEKYCPSLIGILAKCNISQGCNYFKCTNLSKVTEVDDRNAALGAGKFVLINDGAYVRIARGINSMTTTNGTTATDDMKEIEVVEAMDLMQDDISTTFKEDYLGGGYKNKYDNQILFISAVNGYFKELAADGTDVLDGEYDNKSDIDVEAQRAAWITAGTSEASSWTDLKVRRTTYKRSLFLTANVKVLQSMVDLKFVINLA